MRPIPQRIKQTTVVNAGVQVLFQASKEAGPIDDSVLVDFNKRTR
ncbi:MAG TPA: hypothetical protein PKA53_03085 [Sphingobacterium sp.]|nr:hypothetical protein [Sphingobacterium sp.]